MSDPAGLGARLLAAVRAGTAPRPAKVAAAKGALPLTPAELIAAQVALAGDADAEVAAAASASLAALDAAAADLVVDDPEADEAALLFLASCPSRWPRASARLAASSALAGAALRPIAASALASALAALAANNRALDDDPELGRLLAENPALGGADRARLLDYLDEQRKRAGAEEKPEPIEETLAAAATPARDPFLAALGIDAEVEALLPQLGLDLGKLGDRSELMGETEDEDDLTLVAKLQRLNVGQKLRIALFGGREARTLLIRDSNRCVSTAVVKNPKFTAAEAESAANSRNVDQEVLRLVARHRDFSQVYKIQLALVRNPRCPLELAAGFTQTLNDRDLKLLLKNRNISEAVRRQAKRVVDMREARRRVRMPVTKH
ncbi:MAG: hypothetical protein ABFD65_03190 [Candidatus Polarisedimenticolia bacterium]|nr:hypothetical protein [bacterium]